MNEYTIDVNGVPHTFQFDDEDAKARGLLSTKQAPAPKNKQAPTKSKASGGADTAGDA